MAIINFFGMRFDEIWLLIGVEIIGGIGFLLFYTLYTKYRFDALLCEPYLDTFKVKKKLLVHMRDETFSWKEREYNVNFQYATFNEKNKPVVYYNMLSAEPFAPLKEMDISGMDSSTFQIATKGKIMQHLASRRMEKWYTYIIIALVVGLILVVGLAIYIQYDTTQQFAILTERMLNQTLTNSDVVIVR